MYLARLTRVYIVYIVKASLGLELLDNSGFVARLGVDRGLPFNPHRSCGPEALRHPKFGHPVEDPAGDSRLNALPG
jgi:hypothetical protein